jgi:hypothetical protein
MSLNRSTLYNGLRAVKSEIADPVEDQIKAKCEELFAQFEQGSLDAVDFATQQAKEIKKLTDPIKEKVITRQAEALRDYLNGMQDPMGDNLLAPFTTDQLKVFFRILSSGNPQSDSVDAVWSSRWTSFFPLKFQLTKPPVLGGVKVTSTGAPTPIPTSRPLFANDRGDYDAYINTLCDIFVAAATPIMVTITHTVPPHQSPGPPVISKVL